MEQSQEERPKKISWAPQPGPQEALIHCPYQLIGFGGARGGGKTDGVLGKFGLKAKRYGRAFNAVFFRREMPQADDLIDRAQEIYIPTGAEWHEQKKLFIMPGGGRIRFRPLENDADAQKYQGQNLSDAAVEEAGNYSDPSPLWKLFGALRSTAGVPAQLILTFNPGGPGHWWLKEKFIKPAPLGMQPIPWKLPTGKVVHYVYIPSKVQQNKILMLKDPGYIDRLHLVGSPELVRAWLEGDFEIHMGSYFPEFSSRHIIAPFAIPQHWTSRYLGFDWGYHSPFCAVWGAVSSGKWDNGKEAVLPDGRLIPKGAIVIYREAWGKGIDNADIAQKIVQLSEIEPGRYEDLIMAADPSIMSHEGGPSINDQFKEVFARHKFSHFRSADNDRISGWSQIRRRLKPNPAMLYIFSTCPYLIETLPALAIDEKKPEDLDTTGNDHAADALRYLCKERVLESILEIKSEPVRQGVVKVKDFIDQQRRKAREVRI
jgi:Terminase-like family.